MRHSNPSAFSCCVDGSIIDQPFDGDLVRVFPTHGKRQPWPKTARKGGGGPLLYSNGIVKLTSAATRQDG